jgi:hypothetical protein
LSAARRAGSVEVPEAVLATPPGYASTPGASRSAHPNGVNPQPVK